MHARHEREAVDGCGEECGARGVRERGRVVGVVVEQARRLLCARISYNLRVEGRGGTGTHEVGVDARVDAGDPAHEVILLALHVRRELGALDGSEHAQHACCSPAIS